MSDNEKLQEQKEKIVKTLATMFDYLGLNASLRIEEKGNRLAVKITSDDAGRIIGRKGQALESLQLLLNRIMFKDNPSVHIPVVHTQHCTKKLLRSGRAGSTWAAGERGRRERRRTPSAAGAPRAPPLQRRTGTRIDRAVGAAGAGCGQRGEALGGSGEAAGDECA